MLIDRFRFRYIPNMNVLFFSSVHQNIWQNRGYIQDEAVQLHPVCPKPSPALTSWAGNPPTRNFISVGSWLLGSRVSQFSFSPHMWHRSDSVLSVRGAEKKKRLCCISPLKRKKKKKKKKIKFHLDLADTQHMTANQIPEASDLHASCKFEDYQL